MVETVTVNPIFVANMARLWRRDPRLAQQIDDVPPEVGPVVEPSRAGLPTARAMTPDGKSVYLHSRHDPVREAKDFAEKLDAEQAGCVVLSGLGLGHHVRAIRAALGDDAVIVVCEPDLATLKSAFEHTDLSAEIEGGGLEFIAQADTAVIHERLNRHTAALAMGMCYAVPPVARAIGAEFHAKCRAAIADFAAFVKMSLVTLVNNSTITCRNIANNLPTYVTTPPADILRQRFAGCPAVLVAAGPSLAKNVDQLRGLEDRAVLIAAQTTLRPLLARGITPHFVTSLDFSDLSRQFFEGLAIPDDLVLVAEPKATWHVIDAFRGRPDIDGRRVVLLDNEFAHRCLGERLAKRTPMPAGATVMHLAFYLAQWMGCDPIVFIGQDLGFSGHTYYTPGVAIHRAWASELGRFGTVEMKEWERIGRHRPILRKAVDVHGAPIYTDDQMFSYLQQFERDFAQGGTRVIDATEGGVRKAGTEVMPLAEVIAQHCTRPIPAERLRIERSPWYQPHALAPARAELVARRGELDRFRAICEETLALNGSLEELVDRPTEFNRLIVRVDELRTLVQEQGVIFRMVSGVSQRGELMKVTEDRRMSSERLKGRAHTLRQLKRDRAFVEALLAGCDEMASILDQALARFDAVMGGGA